MREKFVAQSIPEPSYRLYLLQDTREPHRNTFFGFDNLLPILE